MDDEQAVRARVESWVAAIVAGDLAGVVSHHTADAVMFDVPPPQQGVRGLAAYRETWPPFFEYLQSGATFEITELDATAGTDVAFAWALLRCGSDDDLAKEPDNRLRITLGLRKVDGEWHIAHEHHSFPLSS